MIEKINNWLNPKRVKYPWIISGIFWAAWLFTLVAGKGNTDLAGNLKGTDFAAFYGAGKIILMGRSAELYSLDLANAMQQALYGFTATGFNPYLNPPHFALFMVPFALLPYLLAYAVWILLGLLCLWFSIKWLGVENPKRAFLWALTWFPVFCVVSFGQNSFITLAITCLTYSLWMRERNFAAGIIFSLLLFKPQFLAGIGLLWLLDWRKNWKALTGLGLGALCQAGLSALLLPEASLAYLDYARTTLPNLMHLYGFPIWNAFSVQSFWQGLFPGLPALASILFWVCIPAALFFFYKFWKRYRAEKPVVFAGAVVLLVWCVPYLMIYDWSLLLIPALLFWKYFEGLRKTWKAVFAILWGVGLLSSILTYLQAEFMPFSFQLAIPVLAWMLILTYKQLMSQPLRGSAAR